MLDLAGQRHKPTPVPRLPKLVSRNERCDYDIASVPHTALSQPTEAV